MKVGPRRPPRVDFSRPPGVVTVGIDQRTGRAAVRRRSRRDGRGVPRRDGAHRDRRAAHAHRRRGARARRTVRGVIEGSRLGSLGVVAALLLAPIAIAAGAVDAVAQEAAQGLGQTPAAVLVVAAPLVSDRPAPRGDEMALRIAALVAGSLGAGARAHPRPRRSRRRARWRGGPARWSSCRSDLPRVTCARRSTCTPRWPTRGTASATRCRRPRATRSRRARSTPRCAGSSRRWCSSKRACTRPVTTRARCWRPRAGTSTATAATRSSWCRARGSRWAG